MSRLKPVVEQLEEEFWSSYKTVVKLLRKNATSYCETIAMETFKIVAETIAKRLENNFKYDVKLLEESLEAVVKRMRNAFETVAGYFRIGCEIFTK